MEPKPLAADPQIALVVLAHKNPAQVRELLRRVSSPHVVSFLHIDRAAGDAKPFVPAEGNVQLVEPRHRCRWGDPGLIDAILSCLRAARRHAPSARYVCLISGQDWPLIDAQALPDRVASGDFAAHISGCALSDRQSADDKLHRLQGYWAPGWVPTSLLRRIVQRLLKLLPARSLQRLPPLWFGSVWFDLRADLADHVLDYAARHPKYRRAFRLSRCADEIFFHTIVFNSPWKEAVSQGDESRCLLGLRYIDWSRGGRHPRTLGPEDLAAARASGATFARKFDWPPEAPTDTRDSEQSSA